MNLNPLKADPRTLLLVLGGAKIFDWTMKTVKIVVDKRLEAKRRQAATIALESALREYEGRAVKAASKRRA